MNSKKGNALALIPILVFLVIYIGTGVYFQYIKNEAQGFYIMPVVVAFLIALTVAIIQKPKISFDEKLKTMAKGVGDENIVIMILIFLFAGCFGGLAKAAGGSESTAYFLLSIIPPRFIVLGLFLIGCIISMAMGTSVGTISLLVPIAVATAKEGGLNVAMSVAGVIGGAMFGDNLSFISDTTIAATKTQGCEMKDKFKENFLIALPAAVITCILLMVFSSGVDKVSALDYNIWQALPYFVALIMAICGINVFLVLGTGIILFALVGILTVENFGYAEIFAAMGGGSSGMFETIIVAVLVAAMGAIMKENGGFDYLLGLIRRISKGKSGAQLGIGVLTSVMDVATANNTIAIVMAGPIAKEISTEYGVSPKRTASLMDIFSCVWQGIIPYGAQMLVALGLVADAGITLSAFDLFPYMFYTYLLLICAIVSVFVNEK